MEIPLTYPDSRRDETVADVLHGHKVTDPYRWLEDPDSAETADWVRRQNDLSQAYLADLPGRAWFSRTMSAVMHRPRAGVPGTKAGWYLVSRNDGSTPQDIVYAARSLAELLDGGRAIVDSHKFTATLQWVQAGDQPVLTRVETSTGHGFGKPAGVVAAECADVLAFAAHHTGLVVPPE